MNDVARGTTGSRAPTGFAWPALLLTVAPLLATPGAARAQEQLDLGKAREQVLSWLGEYSKIEFQKTPEIRQATPDELRPIVQKEQEFIFQRVLAAEQAKIVSQKLGQTLVASAAAKYSLQDKVVYVLMQNLIRVAKRKDLDAQEQRDLLCYVLLHEMTHAFQDERLNLRKRIEALRNAEDADVLNAMIEGHAEFVSRRIAQKVRLSEKVQALGVESVSGMTVRSGEQAALAAAQEMFHLHYEQGRAFFSYLHDKGGTASILAAWGERWPKDTSVLLHPERFFDDAPTAEANWAEVLKDVDGLLEDWKVSKGSMGEAVLKTTLAFYGLPQEKLDAAVNGFVGGRRWTCVAPGQDLGLAAYQFRDAKSLRAFLDAYDEGEQTLVSRQVYTNYKRSPLELTKGFQGLERHITSSLFGQTLKILDIRVSKGPLLVCVYTMNEDSAGDLPRRVAEKIAGQMK